MYVRLAFAVAAHLEPEILLVDEVLAVGDAAFQKKCLGKMGDVAREGRTIVFVSHNMAAIDQLCTKAIWLDRGRIVDEGRATDVIDRYNSSFAPEATGTFESANVTGDGNVELLSYTVTNGDGQMLPLPTTGHDVVLNVDIRVKSPIMRPASGVSIWSPGGALLTSLNTDHLGLELDSLPVGEHTVSVRLEKVPYLPGPHRVDFWVSGPGGHLYAHVEDAITFEIGDSPLYGTTLVDRGFGSVYTKIGVSIRPTDLAPLTGFSQDPGPNGHAVPVPVVQSSGHG